MIETVHGQTKTLQSCAVYNEDKKQIAFFVLNLNETETLPISFVLDGFGTVKLNSGIELEGFDLNAKNTFATPNAVTPKAISLTQGQKDSLCVEIKPLSFAMYLLDVTD